MSTRSRRTSRSWMRGRKGWVVVACTALAAVVPSSAFAAAAYSADGYSYGTLTSSSTSVQRVVKSGSCKGRSSYILYGPQGQSYSRLETSGNCPASASAVAGANYGAKVCTNIAGGPDSCSGWFYN